MNIREAIVANPEMSDRELATLLSTKLKVARPDRAARSAIIDVMVEAGTNLTQKKKDDVLNEEVFPLGKAIAPEEIAAERVAITRQEQIDAVAGRVTGVYGTFMNELVNPATADPAREIPTWEQFLALVEKAKA